jgi:hypothetical protein
MTGSMSSAVADLARRSGLPALAPWQKRILATLYDCPCHDPIVFGHRAHCPRPRPS